MYGHLYYPHLLYSEIPTEHYSVFFGLPSRNLRMYAKTQSRFFWESVTTPTEFRACVFFVYTELFVFCSVETKIRSTNTENTHGKQTSLR